MSSIYPTSYIGPRSSLSDASRQTPMMYNKRYDDRAYMLPSVSENPSPRDGSRHSRQHDRSRLKKKKSPSTNRSKSAPPQGPRYKMFDPVKDLHLWTMWRIGATEKIINEIQNRERYPSKALNQTERFGAALKQPPGDLARYIKVTETTRRRACDLMDSGDHHTSSGLLTRQFIYFGLPRIYIKSTDKI